jgi:TRAP-type C4-dicarboxylate transport system permease small subunit
VTSRPTVHPSGGTTGVSVGKRLHRWVVAPLDRALGHVDKAVLVACCGLLFGLFAVVIVAVFFRYVVNASLLWGEELVRYMAIWLVFLGLSSAHRRSSHVSVNSVLDRLPRISTSTAKRLGEAMTCLLCAAVCYFGWLATAGNISNHQLSPAMQIPIAWIYLAIPTGFGLMTLQSFVRMCSLVDAVGPGESSTP